VHPFGEALGFFKEILGSTTLPTVRECQCSDSRGKGVLASKNLKKFPRNCSVEYGMNPRANNTSKEVLGSTPLPTIREC
jgi:hypothetical protein